MRCNDCGCDLNSDTLAREMGFRTGGRTDVCDGCWDTRGKLARGELFPVREIGDIQRAMASGRGTARRLIERKLAAKAKGKVVAS